MILYRLLYSIFIGSYLFLLHLASLWNPKARLWVNGRKRIFSKIRDDLKREPATIIWMHCSSLGEFEQGRPVFEKIKSIYPGHKTLLTFFSPSGYTIIKNKAVADYVYYLPFGGRGLASQFINLVKPVLVLWVKYDYWFYYLDELKKRNIPLLLISANFQSRHIFFKWYGGMYRRMLQCFTHLFVQTQHSKDLLHKIGFSERTTVSGDTRFDRVIEIADRFERLERIENFCGNNKVIVAGSTWPEDEEELRHFANTYPEIKLIIAPHEIDQEHLRDIEKLFVRSIRYSVMAREMADDRWPMAEQSNGNVLIIDNIGMLSRLYHYATITYIGGGFGEDGIHNVLEAAVYGKPVIFGPIFNKFIEAIELLEEGGAYTVESALELEKVFNELFSDRQLYLEVCEAAKKYVLSKKGATEKVIQYIQEKRLLTN
jgi:3-deoxy-D-manno-octulosonic-acid transferase